MMNKGIPLPPNSRPARVPRYHQAGASALRPSSPPAAPAPAAAMKAAPIPKASLKPKGPPVAKRPSPTKPVAAPKTPPAPVEETPKLAAPTESQSKTPDGKNRIWFIIISVLAHVVFLAGAWYLVVNTITERPTNFKAVVVPPTDSQKKIEHTVQLAQKREAMSAPVQPKRITATGASAVNLPELELTPDTDSSLLSDTQGLGLPGRGASLGLGGLGATNSPGMAATPFFGVSSPNGGIEGNFYDMKRDRADRPTGMNVPQYTGFLKKFLSGAWRIPSENKYWKSPTKLYANQFFFPAIPDTEAGRAFQAPESDPGEWIAHYKGTVVAAKSGTFRLVGFGDNVMIVKLGGTLVLDASDHGYSGTAREEMGAASFPNKRSTPIFAGKWFTLREGESKSIEILVGDEGGIYCAGLFVETEGMKWTPGPSGIPQLPLFSIAPISDSAKGVLQKYLPQESLTGSPFRSAERSSSGLPALPGTP